MKKHSIKKLQLRKETLTILSQQNLQKAKGGAPVTALPSCAVDCFIANGDFSVNINSQVLTIHSYVNYTMQPTCNNSGFRGCLVSDWCQASMQIACITPSAGVTFCAAC